MMSLSMDNDIPVSDLVGEIRNTKRRQKLNKEEAAKLKRELSVLRKVLRETILRKKAEVNDESH